jgi:hypothetical protein
MRRKRRRDKIKKYNMFNMSYIYMKTGTSGLKKKTAATQVRHE